MDKYLIDQTALRRAWEDTKKSFHSIKFFWAVEVVGVALFAYLATVMTPENANKFITAAYPAIGAIIGAIIGFGVIYLIMWFMAPYRQRNEARKRVIELEAQLNKPELFDVEWESQSHPMNLLIAKREDGQWVHGTGSIGPSSITVVNKRELLTITQLEFASQIRFV